MKLIAHPLVQRDILAMASHVYAVSGDGNAARRRVAQARELIAEVMEDPRLGAPLADPLSGWRVRHGGAGRRISVVFRHDAEADQVFLALVSFGGQDWETRATGRKDFP